MKLKPYKSQNLLSIALLSSLLAAGLMTPGLAHPVKKSPTSRYPVRTQKFTQKSSVYSPIAKPSIAGLESLDLPEAPEDNNTGGELSIHVPVHKIKNPEMKFVIEMTCPPGETITHLSYQQHGQDAIAILNQPTPFNAYSETMTTQLSSLAQFDQVYQKLQNLHENFARGDFPEIKQNVTQKPSLTVQGQCSGDLQAQQRQIPMQLIAPTSHHRK